MKNVEKHTNIRRIKNSWLPLAIIATVLLISGCAAPRGVKSKGNFSKSSNNSEKVVAKNKDASKPSITTEQKYIAEINAMNPEQNNSGDENSPTNNEQNNNSIKKLPTLREQMKSVEQEQINIKSDIKELKQDVKDMKNRIEGIQSNVNNNTVQPDAIAGELVADKLAPNNDEYTLLSDEKAAAPEKKVEPAPVKKVKKEKKATKVSKKSKSKNISKNEANKSEKNALAIKDEAKHKVEPAKNQTEIKTEETKPLAQGETASFDDALTSFKSGDYNLAIDKFSKVASASKDNKTSSNCNYWIGESYFGLKQYDKAIAYFQKVINAKGSPKTANAQIMIAEANIRLGKIPEAKKAFQTVVEKYPRSEYIARAKKMLQQL